MMYFYVITNFGNIAAASDSIWSLKGLAVVQVVVIIAVQLLYLMRIWKRESPFIALPLTTR